MRLAPHLPALLALGLLALGAAGCQNSCDQLCAENARYIDGCLETWEATWPDMGYDGVRDVESEGGSAGDQYDNGPGQEYDERCRARYDAAIYFSHPEDARTVREGCAEDLRLVSAAVGCRDYMPGDTDLDPTEGG